MRANGARAGALGVAVAGGIGLGFGIRYGIWDGGSPLSGFFPAISGGALCLFGLLVALREPEPPAEPDAAAGPPSLRRILGYLAGLLAFAFLMEPVGALPMVVLMFLWLLAGVERLAWRVALPVTAAAALGAWLLFDRLLQVPLPRGLFG